MRKQLSILTVAIIGLTLQSLEVTKAAIAMPDAGTVLAAAGDQATAQPILAASPKVTKAAGRSPGTRAAKATTKAAVTPAVGSVDPASVVPVSATPARPVPVAAVTPVAPVAPQPRQLASGFDQCYTAVPDEKNSQWQLWTLSGAFLQIFRNQLITCSGSVVSWSFRSSNVVNRTFPVFSIWEESKDENGTLRFVPVGTTNIRPQSLESQGGNWYRYRLTYEEQIPVDASKKQYIGLFYEALGQAESYVIIDYMSPPNSINGNSYDNVATSTIVGYMTLPQIIGNMTAVGSAGVLSFNTDYMVHDMRMPFFQAFIGAPLTTTTTTTPRPTTKPTTKATTPKPTTTTTPPPTYCYGALPWVENGGPLKPAYGYLNEVVPYGCGYAYTLIGQPFVSCSILGIWIGAPTCRPNRLACPLPLRVGYCQQIVPSYYFDKNLRECRRFFYSGCGGDANRFTTKEDCENVCRDYPEFIDEHVAVL